MSPRWLTIQALLVAAPLTGPGCSKAKEDAIKQEAKEEDVIKGELKRFEGTWVVVSVETEGKPVPEDQVFTSSLTFQSDNTVVAKGQPQWQAQGKFTIDPTKKPKEIDYSFTNEGGTIDFRAIYEWDGDVLKVYESTVWRKATGAPPPERPRAFVSETGFGCLWRFRRAK